MEQASCPGFLGSPGEKHIQVHCLQDGSYNYKVQIKLFWPDDKVNTRYIGIYDSLPDAIRARDVAMDSFKSEREAARIQMLCPVEWEARGLTASVEPDETDVWERACAAWEEIRRLEEARQTQRLDFPGPVVTIAFLADQHVGGAGVDYPRLMAEARLIAETPGMVAATCGDVTDNFIVPKLLALRTQTRLNIPDEAVLAKMYLGVLTPKLVAAVGGNHEGWTQSLAGFDYFAELVLSVSQKCLYDPHDCRVTVKVGSHEWRLRLRHKWRGSSYINALHGIQRASREDQDFDIGVGAHTHVSGLAGTFTTGGKTRLALLCGSYKRSDMFSRQIGFPTPNNSTAVAVLLDGTTGTMTGFESLDEAARMTRLMLGKN